jgi:hypothetical protein
MSARTDPRGGYQATGIPTATTNQDFLVLRMAVVEFISALKRTDDNVLYRSLLRWQAGGRPALPGQLRKLRVHPAGVESDRLAAPWTPSTTFLNPSF